MSLSNKTFFGKSLLRLLGIRSRTLACGNAALAIQRVSEGCRTKPPVSRILKIRSMLSGNPCPFVLIMKVDLALESQKSDVLLLRTC